MSCGPLNANGVSHGMPEYSRTTRSWRTFTGQSFGKTSGSLGRDTRKRAEREASTPSHSSPLEFAHFKMVNSLWMVFRRKVIRLSVRGRINVGQDEVFEVQGWVIHMRDKSGGDRKAHEGQIQTIDGSGQIKHMNAQVTSPPFQKIVPTWREGGHEIDAKHCCLGADNVCVRQQFEIGGGGITLP